MTAKVFLQGHIWELSKKFNVTVVAHFSDKEELDFLDKSISVHSIPIKRNISIIHDIKAFFLLLSFFRTEKFHVIHSVTPKAGLLAMSAGFFANIKCRFHTFTGQVWITKKGWKRYCLKSIDRLMACFTTFAFVDSKSQRDFLINEKILSSQKSTVLADGSISGVDIKRFSTNKQSRTKIRKELNIPENSIIFLFLGRLNVDKGVLDLVAGFKKIISKYPAFLLIVGPDETMIKKQMIDIIGEYKQNLLFVGYTDSPEEYMNASDIFCLPSYREGFGSVIIEAAAVGIPAIGSDIYGISDAIVDGQTGLLFKVGDINDLTKKMDFLASDMDMCKQFGENAKQRVHEKFPISRLSMALLEKYMNLVGNQ